jgi:hypothetical protein
MLSFLKIFVSECAERSSSFSEGVNIVLYEKPYLLLLLTVCHSWNYCWGLLCKTVTGTVARDFLLLVFFMNQFPHSPRVSRFKFFWTIAEILASQGARPVSTTLLAKLPLVSTTPVQNLPPIWLVSGGKFATSVTTLVANCHQYQRHRQQICHLCKRQQWQTMETIIRLLTS